VVAGTTRHASQDAGYGDYITLTSSADPSKKYLYAHLSARERAGTVSEGDKIGETGATGNASSNRPHLHFTVMENGDKVDPDGKGFSKPTQVIERTGSTATAINYSDPEPCTPCA
jgi:murein DD-endopeptidase MepM/ murein hydrolase activator NlpD